MRTARAIGTDLLFTASIVGGAILAIVVHAAAIGVNKLMTKADDNLYDEPDPSGDLGECP